MEAMISAPLSVPMRDTLLRQLMLQMQHDPQVVLLSADFGSPVIDELQKAFPNQFYNVGIAEQNLINLAAGMALEGFHVYCYAIAPFLSMRCYEQIRVNLSVLSRIRPMAVTLVGVGAGFSYPVSGPTHQCYEDLALMRALPSLEILSPSDEVSAGEIPAYLSGKTTISYIRLDAQPLPRTYTPQQCSYKTGFLKIKDGSDACIIATGYAVHIAAEVYDTLIHDGISVSVIDLFNLTHFNPEDLEKVLNTFEHIITFEEAFVGVGGLDALVSNFLQKVRKHGRLLNIGIPLGYSFELGTRAEIHASLGLDTETIKNKISSFVREKNV